MKYKQQNQTKNFFELDAKNWSRKSNFKENLILNTIQERNYYVLKQIKLFKLKSVLNKVKINDDYKILINGVWIGITKEPKNLIKFLRELRSKNIIHQDISISLEKYDREIRIFSDEGRLLRPLIPVNNTSVAVDKSSNLGASM